MRQFTKQQTLVKELRVEQNRTLRECAEIIGISLQRVWQLEKVVYKKLGIEYGR